MALAKLGSKFITSFIELACINIYNQLAIHKPMGTYNKTKHRQIMVHASTKERLLKMFPRLKVKTYNAALEMLLDHAVKVEH